MLPGTLFSSKSEPADNNRLIIIIMKGQIKETRDKETEIFEASENQL
jgi:hypothetical protein